MNPKEVLEFAKKNDSKQLDLRFTDIPSLQHHVSYPIKHLEESSFEEGFGMDGSSIRGWAAIVSSPPRARTARSAGTASRTSPNAPGWITKAAPM